MSGTIQHYQWLIDTGRRLNTADGRTVEVWDFQHQNDDDVLTSWASHFRNHYCRDDEIDDLRRGIGCTRAEYLNRMKFPDPQKAPGPSIRAGDFGEVLVADYLEFLSGYWVPRTRYCDKTIRNESTKGSDVIGFKLLEEGTESSEDELAIFEVKTHFSGNTPKARLQDAVDDSKKDIVRKAESLNAIKQRLFGRNELNDATKIERFQNEVDRPYKEIFGAVALFENRLFDEQLTLSTDTSSHPNSSSLVLVVINGDQMMTLVHDLYKRAGDEA